MYNLNSTVPVYDEYTKYQSPDPILLLSNNIKPQYIPYFYVDTSSFFNLSNYDSKGIPNALIVIILLILVIGIIYDFALSF